MPFDRIAGSSASSLLCERKTNPKKGHQMLSEDNMGQWATPISALASLTSWSKHWPGAKVCPNPLETDCPCLLIDFFETAPPLIWKKAPGRSKVPGSQGTSRRWTDTQTLHSYFRFFETQSLPICIPTRCHRTSCNQKLSNHSECGRLDSQKLGWWCSGDLDRWCIMELSFCCCLKSDIAGLITDLLCKCWGRIMMMMMMVMMRLGSRSV